MDRINIYAVIRLGSFALNMILLLVLYKGCNCEPCHELQNKTVVIEKVYVDTNKVKDVVNTNHLTPKKTTPIKRKSQTAAIDTMPCDTVRILLKEVINILPDTLEYSDTLREADNYKIIYNAKVAGQLLNFKLQHFNLKPDTRTTITNNIIKKPMPQVYMGAVVGVNNTATNFVAGVSAAVAYRSFMGNYTYDIRSGSHQIGGYWRIWGK